MVIEDVRTLIFPLLSADVIDDVVQTKTIVFHGTAFFVSAKGLALSAAHIVPPIETLGKRKLFAGVQREQFNFFRVRAIQHWRPHDICTIEVAIDESEHFKCFFGGLTPGEDVVSVGVPEHELWSQGDKQIRVLKGHVAFATNKLAEMSFPVPKGMSGSPVLVGGRAAGVLVGNWRSEQLDDRIEEIVEVSNSKELVRIIETKEIVNAGVAIDIAIVKNLQAFIEARQ